MATALESNISTDFPMDVGTLSLYLSACIPPEEDRSVLPDTNSLLANNLMQADELEEHYEFDREHCAEIRRLLHSHIELPTVLHMLAREIQVVFAGNPTAPALSYIEPADENDEGLLVTIQTSADPDDAMARYDALATALIWDPTARRVADVLALTVHLV